jgi:hypothetical protein
MQPRAPRVAVQCEAIVYAGNQQLTCTAGNISVSGMLVHAPTSGRPGQFIRVNIFLDANCIDTDALLVRVASSGRGHAWGLRFLDLPAHQLALLARFIQFRLQQAVQQAREARADSPAARIADSLETLAAEAEQPARRDPTLEDLAQLDEETEAD